MRLFVRLLTLLRPYWWQVALAIILGSATVASNIALLGMAAYLIAAAALAPLLVLLTLPIYIVRFMGVSRAVGATVSGCCRTTSPFASSPGYAPGSIVALSHWHLLACSCTAVAMY